MSTKLLNINDDCLFTVFDLLDFPDQVTLMETCRRFQYLIEDIWLRSSKKVVLSEEHCRFFKSHKKAFKPFLKSVSKNVEKLEFNKIRKDSFVMVGKFMFQKVVQLTVKKCRAEYPNDDLDVDMIIKSFPQLSKLCLRSGITGKNLWTLKKLTELDLSCCKSLNSKYLDIIITLLPLKKLNILNCNLDYSSNHHRLQSICDCLTLEELYIDDYVLDCFIKDLYKLKKLRKLVSFRYGRDYTESIYDNMSMHYGVKIKNVTFDGVFVSIWWYSVILQRMGSLERLIINMGNMKETKLFSIANHISSSLKEFRCLNANIDKNAAGFEAGLLYLLETCQCLEICDISGCEVGAEFLKKAIEKLRRKCNENKKPLLFRCAKTKITEEDLKTIHIPTGFEVSLSEEKLDLPGKSCIQFEWDAE